MSEAGESTLFLARKEIKPLCGWYIQLRSPVQALFLHSFQEGADLSRRSQMVHPFRCGRLRDQAPVFGRQVTVAEPEHAIALHRAAP